eukprot:GSChrysophyteH1.ASY1.ANO1.2180.1 assembled CDS
MQPPGLRIISNAPGRVCLFGDHQDYLLNPVIACAIDRNISITAFLIDTDEFVIHKADLKKEETIKFTETFNTDEFDLLRLSLRVLERYGCRPCCGYGFDVTITGDIPVNAGLSSSSALTIAWIHFLIVAFGVEIPYRGTTYKAEVSELGMSGGKMDHYSIAVGSTIALDTRCDTYEKLSLCKMMPNVELVIVVSGQAKDTNGTLSHLKTQQIEALDALRVKRPKFDSQALVCPVDFREDLSWTSPPEHIVGAAMEEIDELLRPYLHAALFNHYLTASARALLIGAFSSANPAREVRIGELMTLHQQSLCNDLKNSTELIDSIILACLGSGRCLGAKIVGSGGGGCVVALVKKGSAPTVIQAAIEAGAIDAFVTAESTSGPVVTVVRGK